MDHGTGLFAVLRRTVKLGPVTVTSRLVTNERETERQTDGERQTGNSQEAEQLKDRESEEG